MKVFKKTLLVIVSLAIVAYIVDYGIDYYYFRLELKAVNNLVHDRIPESISQHDTSDWKRVKSKFGISMMLPKNFVIEEFTYDDGTPVILFWELFEPTGELRSGIFEENLDKGGFSQEFSLEFYKLSNEDDILFSLQQIKHFSNVEAVRRVIADESCFSCKVPFVKFEDADDPDYSTVSYFVALQELGVLIYGTEDFIPTLIQTLSIL